MLYDMCLYTVALLVFFSSRRRHTRFDCDWSSDVCSSDLRNRTAAIKNSGPVIPQCRVRFLNQLATQPIAIAKRIVAADNAWRARQYKPMRLSTPQAIRDAANQ